MPASVIYRRPVTPAAVVVAVIACAVAIAQPVPSQTPTSQAPATQPTATPTVGPIAYYTASCARCHGDIAAPYLGLDHPKRGPALKDALDQMASGPAAAPLDDEGLKQQHALHEAIFGKTPYVWLDPAKPGTGEVLPGTTLTFEAGGQSETPKVTDHRFELPNRQGTLVATREKAVVRIPIPAK